MDQQMQQMLEKMRRSLLDLTRRNRLLNFRGKGRTSLQIVDELPAEVWRILVSEGRTMQFHAREEAVESASPLALEAPAESVPLAEAAPGVEPAPSVEGEDPPAVSGAEDLPPVGDDPETNDEWADAAAQEHGLAELEAGGGLRERHTDRFLQTRLEGETLQTRLVHLAREARSALEERGCNTLFLTIGMVHWTEPGQANTACRAPLVFVPVALDRLNVNSRYKVSVLDEDVAANPSLMELAARLFNVELPAIDGAEEIELNDYLEQVRSRIGEVPGWRLTEEIHLGLFSFAKLLLYHDLDAARWPDSNNIADHSLVRLLCGADAGAPAVDVGVPDPATLDEGLSPEETYLVVDADSSQQAAILAARRGASLVIQGPPGTGKSQTITNIIAECLAAEKTVLFVAEKAAALDVVFRRLERVGLGDFVLELHSRNASKRLVLENLQQALNVPPAASGENGKTARLLASSRADLNCYVADLHRPIFALELSPFEAMCRAAELRDELEAPFEIPELTGWSAADLDAVSERIGALDRCLERVGDLDEHPWRGSRLTAAGLDTRQKITARREPVVESLGRLADLAVQLTEGLKVRVPENLHELEQLLADLDVLLQAPAAAAALVADERWNSLAADLEAWLRQGGERAQQCAVWSADFVADAETTDWADTLHRRRVDGGSLLRFLKPSWYADSRKIRGYLKGGALPDMAQQIELLGALEESRRLRVSLEAGAGRFAALFGGAYSGLDGDWAGLQQVARAAVAIRRIVLRDALPVATAERVVAAADRSALQERCTRTRAQIDDLRRVVGHWLDAVAAAEGDWFGAELAAVPFTAVRRRFVDLEAGMERLQDWVDFRRVLGSCAGPRLESFLRFALASDGSAGRGRLRRVFLRQFYFLLADRALEERDSLNGFRGEDHAALIERFRAADRRWIRLSRERLREVLRQRRPDFSHDASRESKLGILKHEMKKKRRHMPLRKLFSVVGDVVQGIKPCFMMSPISVAQYLAPGRLEFDVVIFDEASQVEPADAFGAIARGQQLLLIGDEKQLPPTNFFTKMEGDGYDGEEDDLGSPSDLESVLGLGAARFPSRNQCTLRWHYRSLHESLIEFSNARFYDNRLRVFPSPLTDRSETGLTFRRVPGVYQRGAGHHNPVEARSVAEEVLRHAATTPHLSLGVGAFSISQQRAIEDQVELLLRRTEDRNVGRFFDAGVKEPFFVKNLETIQGDERDVILLSVGYGPDQDGRVSMNFGPLNREGGWRRLNVLITRSRRRCVVFSSIGADDFRLEATQARGVSALKAYLATAEQGRLVDVPRPAGGFQSPLERSVHDALVARGFEVHSQVGCAGFSIDLGVVHPDHPGRYLCGIECDGALYHSSATARDRDRTRQEVLENRGWTIERIWSTDWFRRPQAVVDRLVRRLEELRSAPPESATPGPRERVADEEPVATGPVAAADSGLPPGLVPYRQAAERHLGDQSDLLALPAAKLGEVMAGVIEEEGPIHVDEALRVVTTYFSTRATKHPRRAVLEGLDAALAQGRLERRGDFLWLAGASECPVRFRGEDCPVTEPDLIPPEEFAAAVLLVLDKEIGIPEEALVGSTRSMMGFKRAGTKLAAAIDAAVAVLKERGEVVVDGGGFLGRRTPRGSHKEERDSADQPPRKTST